MSGHRLGAEPVCQSHSNIHFQHHFYSAPCLCTRNHEPLSQNLGSIYVELQSSARCPCRPRQPEVRPNRSKTSQRLQVFHSLVYTRNLNRGCQLRLEISGSTNARSSTHYAYCNISSTSFSSYYATEQIRTRTRRCRVTSKRTTILAYVALCTYITSNANCTQQEFALFQFCKALHKQEQTP